MKLGFFEWPMLKNGRTEAIHGVQGWRDRSQPWENIIPVKTELRGKVLTHGFTGSTRSQQGCVYFRRQRDRYQGKGPVKISMGLWYADLPGIKNTKFKNFKTFPHSTLTCSF